MKLSSVAAAAGPLLARTTVDYNSAPPNLSSLSNGSLYDTWRPRAHVLPPNGKVGDAAAGYTDPSTGLFHVGYLYSNGTSGATTGDLVTYKDLNPDGQPFITAGGLNDPLAVFDGCVIPEGLGGLPTLFYTSVKFLPIHWTINYTRGSETQSLAVSSDGGRNFDRVPSGPVISDPPFGLNVTGFRDPYVFKSSRLDDVTNTTTPDSWYTVISGGVHDQGPALFLYRQTDPEFQYWDYLGEWWHEASNSTWNEEIPWAGRWGYNFEVANIFGLDSNGFNSKDGDIFVTLGAEGTQAPIQEQVSQIRSQLWATGDISLDEATGKPVFTPTAAGYLDAGLSSYAAAGKDLPASSVASKKSGTVHDRFISYIWLTGDDFGNAVDFPSAQQNWTGTLLLPRELSVGHITNVVDNELSRAKNTTWTVSSEGKNGLLELSTLGQQIAREPLAALTSPNTTKHVTEPGRTVEKSDVIPFANPPASKYYVLSANLTFPSSARDTDLKAGFQILASDKESTTIYYTFGNESISIDRSNTSAAALPTGGISTATESGYLRLFDVIPNGAKEQQVETLRLTVVVDGGVLEVHANERFGLSTWARSWYANSTDIRFFQDGSGSVTFSDVEVYEGLYDAWPDRKA
ncbi:beta-fructofuranosidase [Geosmithia morbida]|uniref:Beta-fructofuranosidase n=1 Tax=Geosmithia morbida TaxID=1094350 RepID=A0A9P4YZE2_9HYPO|nr:beta-fructofuranosidase [Geosmithia morbida]KAF4124541.1 beta-fructofuranosidase [Geosmithia morbida]